MRRGQVHIVSSATLPVNTARKCAVASMGSCEEWAVASMGSCEEWAVASMGSCEEWGREMVQMGSTLLAAA